jgi:hypothetical protein
MESAADGFAELTLEVWDFFARRPIDAFVD